MMRGLWIWTVVVCQCYVGALTVSQAPCRKTKVLVLGAGITGITAAKTLAQSGLHDFVIVEYQDRVGGRAMSTNFGRKAADDSTYVVELGAQWIQGLQTDDGPENPIWALAKKHKLSNTFSDPNSVETFDENGSVDYTYLLKEYDNAWHIANQEAGQSLHENLQDQSFRAGMSLAGWRSRRRRDEVKMSHLQAVDWLFDEEYASSPEMTSQQFTMANFNATFGRFSDESNMVFRREQYGTRMIDDPRLMLDAAITNITYTTSGVTVDTANGECLEADYAICTFSLGVLQNDVVSFRPPLPSWKQSAIQAFQMGTFTKIFLQFPSDQVFWNKSVEHFLFASPHERGHYPSFYNLDHEGFLPGSGILFAVVVSDQAHRGEAQDDETTKAELLAVLQQMYPKSTIPEPIAFMYPRWSTLPWSYGSFSNWPVGATLQTHQNLRSNLDRLYFAGEAGHPRYYAYLHGGYFEGKRIGKRVAACVKSQGKDCPEMVRYESIKASMSMGVEDLLSGWDMDSWEALV